MAITRSFEDQAISSSRRSVSTREDSPALGTIGLCGVATMLALGAMLNSTVVVLFSFLLLVSGLGIGTYARLKGLPLNAHHYSARDVAGLLVLLAFSGFIGSASTHLGL